MKSLFLVNARSGVKRGYDVAELIRHSCDWEHEIVSCGRKEDLDGIIDDAIARGVQVVHAVGGDGTVHEIAKRLVDKPLALGIIPTGSGNGFARHIGLTGDPAASLASCRTARIVTIDTASVNDETFLGVMGIGFDAVVADRFASSSVRGMQTYVKEGLRAFAEFRAEEYELVVDGQPLRKKAFVIAVANSSQYGNDARIAPLASLQDGLLDLVVVDETSVLHAPFQIARLFSGTFNRAAGVTTMQASTITIRRPSPGPAHLDGEPVTLPADLQIRVRPKSLRLLLPQSTIRI